MYTETTSLTISQHIRDFRIIWCFYAVLQQTICVYFQLQKQTKF